MVTETAETERTTYVDNNVTVTVDGITTLTLPSTATAYHIETIWETLYGDAITQTAYSTTTGTTTSTQVIDNTIWSTETEYTSTSTVFATTTLPL